MPLESDVILLATAQRYIKYLVAGLGIGMLSVFVQACDPSLELHFACRFVQGFCGAFLFFYTLFLSASLFEDKPGDGQRVFAMTMASLAMEVAECSGSVLGPALYDSFGRRWNFTLNSSLSVSVNLVCTYLFVFLDGTCSRVVKRGLSTSACICLE